MKEINHNNNQPVIRKIPRMRTVSEAARELKKLDPSGDLDVIFRKLTKGEAK